jgi:hypothetical protein
VCRDQYARAKSMRNGLLSQQNLLRNVTSADRTNFAANIEIEL